MRISSGLLPDFEAAGQPKFSQISTAYIESRKYLLTPIPICAQDVIVAATARSQIPAAATNALNGCDGLAAWATGTPARVTARYVTRKSLRRKGCDRCETSEAAGEIGTTDRQPKCGASENREQRQESHGVGTRA